MIKASLFAAGLASIVASAASADVIAGWSMPTAVAASPTTGATYSYGAANLGALVSGSMLSGTHSSASTAWTSPAGNGSTYALSSNAWNVGDYYQISLATTGYSSVSVAWEQTRSFTGPAGFEAVLSVDGGSTFSSLGAYTVNQVSWNATTPVTTSSFGSVASAADNQASVIIRFKVVTAGTSTTTGTNRIDNISVTGTVVPVPSPGAVALVGLAGLVARRRR
jgi:MYXO-CTERM domain-containing protein